MHLHTSAPTKRLAYDVRGLRLVREKIAGKKKQSSRTNTRLGGEGRGVGTAAKKRLSPANARNCMQINGSARTVRYIVQ